MFLYYTTARFAHKYFSIQNYIYEIYGGGGRRQMPSLPVTKSGREYVHLDLSDR